MQNYQVLQIFRHESKWYNKGDIISLLAEVATRLISAHVIAPILNSVGGHIPQKPAVEKATSDKDPKIERRGNPKAEVK